MILKPTVIVLGAGASQPYGFPSGPALLRQVANALDGSRGFEWNTPASIVARASGKPWPEVDNFHRELRNAKRLSIDAFIESRSADYDEIGRCAIAQCLLQIEDDERLSPPLEVDWHTILFDAILGNSPEAFRQNRVTIVTFNFDRSFERGLYLALNANFKGVDIDELLDVIPVIHAHGDLGAPKWRPKYQNDSQARPYERSSEPEVVQDAASRIRIVHHPVSDETQTKIRTAFASAERILFLGFSYHESNMKKLGIPQSLEGRVVVGTRLNLGEGPVSRVHRLSNRQISFEHPDWDIIRVLRESSWFYE